MDETHYSPNVMSALESLPAKGMKEPQKKYFAAALDWLERNIASQLAKAYPEILRIAEKNSDGGSSASTASIGLGIDFDISNPELLKMNMKLNVAPWKLQLKADVAEDLAQLHLDLGTGAVTRTEQTGEPEGDTTGGGSSDNTGESGGTTGERSGETGSEGDISGVDMASHTYTSDELDGITDKKTLKEICAAKNVAYASKAKATDLRELILAAQA